MNHLLISTKMSIPLPPVALVERPHLYKRLQKSFTSGQRLVVISAPAGFGKTTVLSAWVREQRRYPAVWISLDTEDNAPEVFLQYFLAALTQAVPALALPPIEPSWNELNDSTLRLLLAPVMSALAAHASPIVIALDDYHVIANQAVHTLITFLLKYLPAHVFVVIASRVDPPLPLASLEACQQLTAIHMGDLRFNQHEIEIFFRRHDSLALTDHVVQTIGTYTEGWPVGLQLVALAAIGRSQRETQLFFGNSEHNQFVLEYLAEEVFSHLPSNIQQFLLRTAILDRLTDAVCRTLLEDSVDAATLGDVLQQNLFLTQLGDAQWYRYHHLFVQFLRARLQQTLSARDVTALHVRAGLWFMDHGLRYEALNHLVQAKAWDEVLRLLTPAPPLHEFLDALHIWHRWLDVLPEPYIRSRPDLYLLRTWRAVLSGNFAAAEEALNNSAIAFPPATQGDIHLLRAHIANFRGQLAQRFHEAGRALALLSPHEQPLLWALAAILGGGPETSGDLLTLERAWQIGVSIASPMIMLLSTATLAEMALRNGKLQLASSWLDKARTLVTHGHTVGAPYWCGIAVRVAYEQNDLQQAERIATRGLELVRITGRRHNIALLNTVLARVYAVRGAAYNQTITALLAEAQTAAHQHGQPKQSAEIQAYQLRRWLERGDVSRAQHWGVTHPLNPDIAKSHVDHWFLVAHSDLARTAIHQEADTTYAAAIEPILIDAIATTAAESRWSEHIQLMTVYALLLWDLNRQEEATLLLSKALALGEPEGYLRTFLDEGPALLLLLAHPKVAKAAPALVARLCEMLAPDAPALLTASEAAETLSGRELEILRLVATGLSAQQLATHLVISVHTARTHLKNIYAKLDAHTRLQAVEHARQRGLL